jgi:predicted  nucleic acid-binding Zn-ribbon protein
MTSEERFERLEDILDRLAGRVAALDDALVSLAESQERLYDVQADQYKRTQEQFRQTDGRIERLVSAIGELTRKTKD